MEVVEAPPRELGGRTQAPGPTGRVQATNDESIVCKKSAAARGYYDDRFLAAFAGRKTRRTAFINRGYFARVQCVRNAVKGFVAGAEGPVQVVSLGCGFDTAFFQLYAADPEACAELTWVDVDFPDLVARKAEAIRNDPGLRDLLRLGGPEPAGPAPVRSACGYTLLGLDLRDLKGARSVLFGDLGLNPAVPTLLFAECVLNYMTKAQADRLIRWIPANFAEAALFSYDQARPWDAFGKMLCGNLGKKGAGLKGIDAAASPATQLARWRRLAWTGGGSVAMGTVYAELDPDSVARVEALEPFDEFEDWHVKCGHYTVCWGLTAPSPALLARTRGFPRGAEGAATADAGALPPGGRLVVHAAPEGQPSGRWGHATATVGGVLAVLGGFVGAGVHRRAGALLTSAAEGEFSEWEERALVPTAAEAARGEAVPLDRMGHGVAASGEGELLVFGGRTHPGRRFDDLLRVRVADATYETVRTDGEVPPARWRHTFTYVGELDDDGDGDGDGPTKVYLVYGGWDGETALGDAHALLVGSRGGARTYTWAPVGVEGDVPKGAGRFSHTLTSALPDDHGGRKSFRTPLLLFGGCASCCTIFGDAYVWRLERRGAGLAAVSRRRAVAGIAPRYSHAACLLAPGAVLIAGGCTLDGDDDGEFAAFRVQVDGTAGPERLDVETALGSRVWARQHAETAGPGRVVLVGGGATCFSFGSHFNPLSQVASIVAAAQ